MMNGLKAENMIKTFDGTGEVTTWLRKVKLVATLQKMENLAGIIPLFLEGSAFSVYEQMDESDKSSASAIEKVLLDAFAINRFEV